MLAFTTLLVGAVLPAIGWAVQDDGLDPVAMLSNYGVDVTSLPHWQAGVLNNTGSSCSWACTALAYIYGSDNVFTTNTLMYSAFAASFWSQQQVLATPYCVAKPANAEQVAIAILISRLTNCQFAVKSGGHAAFAGSSNSEGGITIALDRINEIALSSDAKIVSLGPGNIWRTVYDQLSPENLTVTGGRGSDLGVGGLTLGGGISWHSNLYGWACDNVDSYEVVLANGSILWPVDASSYPDLYFALRGGGNNFGIVTKFNMYTRPYSGVWTLFGIYDEQQIPNMLTAFYNLIANSQEDGNALHYVAFGTLNSSKVGYSQLTYTDPSAFIGSSTAAIYDEWLAIPSFYNTSGVEPLVNLTDSVKDENPYGYRDVFASLTLKLDRASLDSILSIWYQEVAKPDVMAVTGIFPSLVLQGITQQQLAFMSVRGGNPLGINAATGPLTLVLISIRWNSTAGDVTVYSLVNRVFNQIGEMAITNGLSSNYVYMNYADMYQNVIASYGEENRAKLIEISQKYDPTGVFQTLQPGYFKLNRPAATL